MTDILNELRPTSRELSILIWCFIGLSFFFKYESVRKCFPPLIRSFFNRHIQTMIWVSISWTYLTCYLMWKYNYWDIFLLKETIIWAITSGVAFTFRAVSQKGNTISQILFDNLKISVLLSFVINIYSFELWIELITFPIISFFLLIDAVAQVKKELKENRKITSILATTCASIYVLFSFYLFLKNISSDQMFYETFKVFLPIVLYVFSLPLFYFWSIISMYQNLFNIFNAKSFRDRPELASSAKWRIIKACHLNPFRLKSLVKNSLFRAKMINSQTTEEMEILIREALDGKLEIVEF